VFLTPGIHPDRVLVSKLVEPNAAARPIPHAIAGLERIEILGFYIGQQTFAALRPVRCERQRHSDGVKTMSSEGIQSQSFVHVSVRVVEIELEFGIDTSRVSGIPAIAGENVFMEYR
jgi:hypothetical protein